MKPMRTTLAVLGAIALSFSLSHGAATAAELGPVIGPELVADIDPGESSSSPNGLLDFNNEIYFVAYTEQGPSVFRSDGTTTEIMPGGEQARSLLAVLGGYLYYVGFDSAHGWELWRTDGVTPELFSDINPGPGDSYPSNPTVVGDSLYFLANDGVHGAEPWTTDGVTTRMLVDAQPGANGSWAYNFTEFNSEVWFVASQKMWRFDGNSAVAVPDIASPSSLAAIGSLLYFSAYDGSSWRPWVTDGAETRSITDVDIRYPGGFTELNGRVYFGVSQAPAGMTGLWSTDGVSSQPVGVGMLAFDNPEAQKPYGDPADGILYSVYDFTIYSGQLYFTASTAETGIELWRTDGQTVQLVADVNPGPAHSYPGPFAQYDGDLYFIARHDTLGTEVWRTNGSVTELPGETEPGFNYKGKSHLVVSGNSLFFDGEDPAHGFELWRFFQEPVIETPHPTIEPPIPSPTNTVAETPPAATGSPAATESPATGSTLAATGADSTALWLALGSLLLGIGVAVSRRKSKSL